MSDNNPTFQDLYKALKADGAVQGDWNSFRKYVGAPGKQGYLNRKKLYDALKADDAVSSPTYEDFHRKLYAAGKAQQQRNNAAKVQQQPSQPQTTAQKAIALQQQSKQGGQAQQTTATPSSSGTDYMANWELLHMRNSEMTPLQRAQANNMRQRMQNASQQQARKDGANPISRSRVNPSKALHVQKTQQYISAMRGADKKNRQRLGEAAWNESKQAFDEDNADRSFAQMVTSEDFSGDEAMKARTKQQLEDDAIGLAAFEVGENKFYHNDDKTFGSVGDDIFNIVDSSMKEADELTNQQYLKSLDKIDKNSPLGSARSSFGSMTGKMDLGAQTRAYKEMQTQRMKNRQDFLMKNMSARLQEIYSQKGMQRHIVESADKLGMSVEQYVDDYVTPEIMNYAQKALSIRNKEEIMPHGTLDYIAKNLSNTIVGMIVAPAFTTKETRQRLQEGIAIADGLEEMETVAGHKDKTFRSGAGTRFLSTTANMAADAPALMVTGSGSEAAITTAKGVLSRGLAKVGVTQAAEKLTAQQLGFKLANMTMAQKIGSGLLEGPSRSALNLGGYSSITSALGQMSTGDDTSLAAVGKAAVDGFVHGSETGGIFGLSGAVMAPWMSKFGINGTETSRAERMLHGAQKVGATAVGLGVEAGTMMVADNITGDKDISVGTWLEDIVTVGAFKAGEPKNYTRIGQALYGLTHNTSSIYRFGKDEQGNWRTVDIRMTKDEQNELINSTSGKNLMDAFKKVDKSSLNSKTPLDKSLTKQAYEDFMNDPNVSQSTKEKVNAAMGLFNTTRAKSFRSDIDRDNKQVLEYSRNGTLLSRTSYNSPDERDAIIAKQQSVRDNDELLSLVAMQRMKDRKITDDNGNVTDDAIDFLKENGYDDSKEPTDPHNAPLISGLQDENSDLYRRWCKFADDRGWLSAISSVNSQIDASWGGVIKDLLNIEGNHHDLFTVLAKDPMKRTDLEKQIAKACKDELQKRLFPDDQPHEEQSESMGRDVAEDNNLGTEQPNSQAVIDELNNLKEAEDNLTKAMESNDNFKQIFEDGKKRGMRNADIYAALLQNGVTADEAAPLAEYMNANARVQGMQQATQQKIEQNVSAFVDDWAFKGTYNGEKIDGKNVIRVQDEYGRVLIVANGDMAFDETNGKAKEDVGDLLICYDEKNKQTVYVRAEDVTLFSNEDAEAYKAKEIERLQNINSVPYNEAARAQAEADAAKAQQEGGGEDKPQGQGEGGKGNEQGESGESGQGEEPKQESTEQKSVKTISDEQEFANETNSPDKISEEKDEWGKPLVKASDGSTNYGEISDGYGLKAAPIRLSLGENKKNPVTGKDEGYGLLHIIARHGDQIRKAGYKSVEEFVEAVSKGYTEIREGVQVGTTQTYLIVKKDGHANTLYIELSRDGKYWNVNSAGIFKEKYVDRKKEIKPEPTVGSSTSTDTTGVNHGQSEGAAVTSGNSPMTSAGKDTNNSSNNNASETTLTFKNGEKVPMKQDSKGRPAPDYDKMTPAQSAEVLHSQFKGSAEKVADARIKKAKEEVKKAEKIKVEYDAEDDADILEQETAKAEAIKAAQEKLEKAEAIKKALTALQVDETLHPKNEGEEGKGEGGENPPKQANVASPEAAAKFQNAKRLQGYKRRRTLKDGTKVYGHYEIVPAESLTPSHDVFNGYKMSVGFPVDKNGHTINDRDYEHDKDAQNDTDLMARTYDGQAIDHVPTVSDEGIVYDGNGRTMAGQKAAKEGTDADYIEALMENAKSFGFTKEQIEQSGIEHPRLVLVTDERLPYDTATFAKFNQNEKKTQSNTEKAVAKAKTLTPDEIGAIVAEVEGTGSLEAFFNNPKAINDLIKTLQEKKVLGHNEVAELLDSEGKLSAQGKEYVKNLLLGSVFSPETIRMMGIDSKIKTKAVHGIRAIMDNMKLGEYSLRDEIDNAIKLFYEARNNGMTVDDLLRQSSMFDENARDRFSPIEQAIAQAFEGNDALFRDLMREYNDVAKARNTGEASLFGENQTRDELIDEFINESKTIKDNGIKLYGKEERAEGEGADNAPGNEKLAGETGEGTGEKTESQQQVDEAVKSIATEITRGTGAEVVTDDKVGQSALEDAEATDSNIKFHKETNQEVLDELNNGETIKVYRAMQVIDGKLYPPMAASVGGKLVEANELGVWIRADENPELAIPDIDPKTGKQKIDKKTGELKWKFKLDKGGKDATGKKATDVNAAYNPYWHMSRSPLNDQFKSAWIRPNIVVVECEVPVSELTSGYKAERAKDAVGEVDWKSGSVSGEVFKQTGRARKVILSRWCKPVRVLDDAEVAQRAKEFVGEAKVEIPENVLTPKQRIAFEEAGFKIGAPEKGVNKSEQIAEAIKKGLQVDNRVKHSPKDRKEFRSKDGEVYGFTDGEKIYLDTKKMKPETPLHEYTHLWTAALKRANPKEWENVKKIFDEVEGLKEEVQKLYPELKGDDLYEEMITTYSGREGAKKLEEVVRELAAKEGKTVTESAKAQGFIGKVKEALQKYWKGVADMLHIHFTTAEEVADKVLADWAKGVNPNEIKGEEKLNTIDSARKAYEEAKKSGNEEQRTKAILDLKQAYLDKINSKEVKKKDEAWNILAEAEELLAEHRGLVYDEHSGSRTNSATIDKILTWAENTLDKITDEPVDPATEKQEGYINKMLDTKTAGDDLWSHERAALEGMKYNKFQASKLIDRIKFLNNMDGSYTEQDIDRAEKEIRQTINTIRERNGAEPFDWDKKVEEPSKDPIKGLKKAAEAYRIEHQEKVSFEQRTRLGIAREHYDKAKKSGNAERIAKAAKEYKQALDDVMKSEGKPLAQRRKEIAKFVGKEEANIIDKPWAEMDSEEREFVANQKPLTEEEIRNNTSEENKNFIEDAVDYINGKHGFAQKIAYLKIYEDVRNRQENAADNSGAKDGTQLAAAGNEGGEGMELGTGRDGGGTAEQLDNGTGGESAPGERGSGESGKDDPTLSVGEQGDKQGEGNAPGLGAVSAGNTDSKGSGTAGTNGTKPKRGGRASGTGPAKPDAKRKPAAKQGTTWKGRTGEDIKKNVADKKAAALAAIAELKKRRGGTLGMNAILTPEQMEYVPTVMNAIKDYGMAVIDQGIYKIKDWFNHIRETFGESLKDCGFSDNDIDEFIEEMWNSKMEMDGETHTIGEWCGIYGNAQLREKLRTPLEEKRQKQMDAESIKVKIGDRKNIEETLPFLLPQQQEDVLKAETQFFGKEHADRDHAYGKGYMFTNGTGTGKTYTGLGIAKRLAKQGKGRILFITPSQPKVKDWIKDGKNLGLDIHDLDAVAKEKGTTATTESGEGMVITTYANMRQNKKLLETEWDAVIYDESHRIMENKKGAETTGSQQHYMLTNRNENYAFLRLQTINEHYQKMQTAADKFNAQRQKEIERIENEYKQTHPGASDKDLAFGTRGKMPRSLQEFAPSDGSTFPELGKLHQEYLQAFKHYLNEVEPKLKEQAKNTWKNTKTIFLSATPFNTRENLDYAEGYIFKYPKDNPNERISPRSRFYMDHFGAAYRFRYNRLEAKKDNPDAIAKQEIAFSDYLQNELGTMSGRIIDSAYDYSRDFPTVAPDHAVEFNNATQEAMRGRYLGDAYHKTIGNYNYGSALFETMKVANIIQRMKDHIAAGRKIVVFHRRVETKEPLQPPFAYMLSYANEMIKNMNPGKERDEAIAEANEFRRKYADLLEWEQTLDYSMPREQIAKAFGEDNVLFFSGKESSKVKSKAVDTFNDDNSGKNIIVIQEASGKEGISLHDTTGNHQRVCITLALPQSPITALQIEGRIYRIGNMSNAIFEYPILGLNSEMMLFGEKFNAQVSTTENLALGSQARSLRESFANGVLEHSGIVPIDQQGVGGKEFDAPKDRGDSDPFDDAVLDYYSNQKLNKRNREGIDYFPTPEPLGYKMVEWANMLDGDTALEPSAGHGAIARYVPRSNQLLSIEPSQSFFTKLQLKAGGLGRKFLNGRFEDYDIGQKHDVVVMNPPFGTAGATAIAHLDKAFKHLDEGGRVVALIPRGSTDKKFDKWLGEQKNVAMRAEVALPDIVFQQAGTRVVCRVVVLDKITDAAMRAKAGYPDKIDLSGHYDKIEDFFEDLRDVSVPDRIVDNVFKLQKKAKSVKKDIEEIKGVKKVEIDRHGISVKMSAGWKTYTIDFVGADKPNYWREKMANKYKMFDELERETFNEDNKAALSELQKLSCKLAGMSEEEMQRFINKGNDGENGAHFRTQYSETKSKDVKNSRIIPEDVDKTVSSQIEKKFDKAVQEANNNLAEKDKELFRNELEFSVSLFSKLRTSEIKNTLKGYEYDDKRWRGTRDRNNDSKSYPARLSNIKYLTAKIAAERELDYREARKDYLRTTYNLQSGERISLDSLERIFKEANRGKESEALFGRALVIAKRLGIEFNAYDEPNKGGRNGESGIDRTIGLYLDSLTRTIMSKDELATTILHEMIHQATTGSINLVKKGKADGVLTPKQIEAVNTILDIYNKVKDDKERFKENTYGLKSEYELAAQMADPRQRKAMDLSIWDRVVNAAHEFARKGDRTILERLKDAVKKLFEVSDKDKMDKAINDIIDDFNEKIDDLSMNDIEETDFGNSPVSISDDAPAVVKYIDSVSSKTGAKVNIVTSAEEVTNKQAKAAIDAGKKVTGWYDEKTGQVHLYMPNIHDSYTAEKTIWHETVGHKGMRELFGDKFDKFLDSVWYDLDRPENAKLKELVMDELKKNPFDYRNAIEEGVARLAEEGKGEPGFWRNIKNKLVDLMHEIGYRIAPNTKDVKYLLWLSKNLQKHPNDVSWRLKADAVKYKLDKENAPEVITRDGMFRDNDGKTHSSDLADMPKKEYQEATDGQVHFRTAPSLGTATDRYHRALNAHGYMATESFMDNMLSLDKLMRAIDPSIKKIEDVESSRNPYMLQNTMQGAMSNAAEQFEMHVMKPLDKAMADLLGAFDGRETDDMIRNFNLYMITKHGLERNRVFFVRDYIKGLEKADAKILQSQWNAEKKDLGDKLNNGSIDLKGYYDEMDEWIRNNVDKDYDASENDYSGLHGVQGIEDGKQSYDDAEAIDSVMSAEAKMEGIKAGSVKDFWSKVRTATDFALGSDYKNGIVSKDNHDNVSAMFDWYVPLRKFDKDTAEDVYGYVTEKGDPSTYIGSTLMNAKGRKSLSETNVLAQIGAMGNAAINRGGQNAIKQAFMRFIRANSGNGLVTESKVWAVQDGTDASGNPIWREAYPDIPEDAAPDEIAKIVSDFETDMKAKQALGDAKVIRNHRDVKFKFERAKDANQHVVDVMVNGSTVRFYVNGNPRAAQALNGMLENQGTKWLKPVASITRTMAQLCTSYSPEFVVRNIVRDAEFAFSNIAAKENSSYRRTWEKYYVGLIGKGIGSISFGDLKGSEGLGLYAKYNNGSLDMSNKVHRYFKEFMENGGETGWVQVLSMKDWEKKYKTDIKTERSKINKGGEILKDFFLGNLKNINEAAENMARFATYCASRDAGRSAVRSAYDAKEVSTNFNRHGSGDRIWDFKNGPMSSGKAARQKAYGFLASYLRQCSMFFNAGIQSTNLLMKNYKHAAKGAATVMTGIPFAMGIAAALVNNWLIASEDEKERKGVKDPYGELPEYVRRNNLCIYKGNGEFVTIPLAIELRAFYGVGDLAAGLTFSKNIKTTRPAWADAVGCLSQLVPIMDYTNSHTVDNSPFNETLKAFSPSAFAPLVEWGLNSDWKGAPIRREKTSYNEYAPAWTRAYKNTPKVFMDMNKKANAMTNDLDEGNENLLGWNALDAATDPSAWNHFLGGFGGGMATFATRVTKLATSLTDNQKTETSDIPFIRSFLYEPNEQSSIARTKSKWYNYIEDMKKDMSNIQTLKKRTVPVDQLVHNYAAYYKIKNSPKAQMAQVIEQAENQMKQLKQMRDKSSDPAAIDNANKTIDNIMMRAVEQLDQLSSAE